MPDSAERVVRRYFDRFGAGDISGVAALFTDDAAFMPNGRETVRGRGAIREYFDSVFDAAHVRFDEVVVDRAVEGADAAVVETRTRETITVRRPARTVVEQFRELFVLFRRDGVWKIDSYVGNELHR